MKTVTSMGMIGLGKMGWPMMLRIRGRSVVKIVGYDKFNGERSEFASLEEFVNSMKAGERVIWLMMSAGGYVPVLRELFKLLSPGDMIVDGGNSYWKTTQERALTFGAIGVHYVDVGTSGGIAGSTAGYATMVGGTDEEFAALQPVLLALKPEVDGLVHAGPSGLGHLTKQGHNGAEYVIMAALGEYAELLEAAGAKNIGGIFRSLRNGSILSSRLLGWAVETLEDSEGFARTAAVVPYSGEGSWTVKDAIDLGVPMPVTTSAMVGRLTSADKDSLSWRIQAGIRSKFGGHAVVSQEPASVL